jgi:hypothetical protein
MGQSTSFVPAAKNQNLTGSNFQLVSLQTSSGLDEHKASFEREYMLAKLVRDALPPNRLTFPQDLRRRIGRNASRDE